MVYVGKTIGLKGCGSKNKKESEPSRKRRIKKEIKKSQETVTPCKNSKVEEI